MGCQHDLAEQETACADGFCPLCLRAEVERVAADYQDLGRVGYEESERIDAALGIPDGQARPRKVEHTLAAIERMKAEVERLRAYVGVETYMSDFQTAAHMRADRNHWKERAERAEDRLARVVGAGKAILLDDLFPLKDTLMLPIAEIERRQEALRAALADAHNIDLKTMERAEAEVERLRAENEKNREEALGLVAAYHDERKLRERAEARLARVAAAAERPQPEWVPAGSGPTWLRATQEIAALAAAKPEEGKP